MSPANFNTELIGMITPELLDQFFSRNLQQVYVSMLLGRGGLTRRRTEYFVRLWAYLLLKREYETSQTLKPLTQLHPIEELVSCTHREAAELFYGNQERGSDRAAGMMIDQLTALGLLEKWFDGQTLCLRVRPLPELAIAAKPEEPLTLVADRFNPRTDAIPVANLIRQTYAMAADDSSISPQRIARILRQWATVYPKGLRVLRRSDNQNPVAISILYPTHHQSEEVFARPPAKSFYLTSNLDTDPVCIAPLQDPDCIAIYVRAWIIDVSYLKRPYMSEFLKDTQKTLAMIQEDYPNICDLYSPVIHPLYEELRMALGFQKTCEEHRPFYWAYLSVDQYIALDIDQVISSLRLGESDVSA